MHSDADPRDPDAPRPITSAGFAGRQDDDEDDLDADHIDDEPAGAGGSGLAGEDEDDDLDEQFPLGDGVAETAAEVWCPYCGEPSEIVVDPGGGNLQRYVEDCPVCCRPWQVTVHFSSDGSVSVACDADDASMDDLD